LGKVKQIIELLGSKQPNSKGFTPFSRRQDKTLDKTQTLPRQGLVCETDKTPDDIGNAGVELMRYAWQDAKRPDQTPNFLSFPLCLSSICSDKLVTRLWWG